MHKRGIWGAESSSPKGLKILELLARKQYPRVMDTSHTQEIKRRTQILAFWKAHGLNATKDAYGVSRRTLFRWNADPTPKSKAHRNGYTKRVPDERLQDEVIRLRGIHPRLGKEKLAPLLVPFCKSIALPAPSESTTGRILDELKKAGRLNSGGKLRMSAKTGKLLEKKPQPRRRKLRRNGYLPDQAGDLLQLDGVLTFVESKRRYTFTAVDLVSRWAYSKTYGSASSRNGADFLRELLARAPFVVTHIQTDNGSEFMKEFSHAMQQEQIIHFHNWVKQPKYQGWIERFNRTIQEEFLDWHHESLGGDLEEFNPQLVEWLTFYNTTRVHRALGRSGQRLSPLQYLETTRECQTG